GLAGTAVPTEAWIGSDVYGDQEIVIVGFAYPALPDDPGHSICVLVDHTERGVAKDAYPAAPLAQTLARWREAEADGVALRPAAVTVCHSLIAYRCDYGDGDPLRWSPTLAGLCLLDHFPVKVCLDAPDVALVPDVLAAWVAFAARRRRLPEAALARVLDVIDS